MIRGSPAPSLAEAGAALRAGTLTAVELLGRHLRRIETADDIVRAFWAMDPRSHGLAAQADAELAAGIDRGPLHGIPFAVKDMVDLKGLATSNGSRLPNRVAEQDAVAVQRLIEAGAVPLGHVATYEWGFVGPDPGLEHPPARNPWNPTHITGGSSSGSAAAVAAGMVRLAVGSDTGGSIRSPSAYCGVVGLKPTWGRVPQDGFWKIAAELDHPGPIAATVQEAALMLDAMAPGTGAASRLEQGAEGLLLGYARDWFARDPACDPRALAGMDEAASALSLAGARIVEVSMPDYDLLEAVGAVIIHVEGLRIHGAALRDRPDLWGRMAVQTLAAGVVLTQNDLAAARALVPMLRGQVDRALDGCDALLCATTLSPAPPFSAFEKGAAWTPMRTLPFNVTGHPAMSVPAGLAGGLPVGLQIIGRHGDEATVCRVGHAFERATDHAAARPDL
ncbi:amidase [Rubellimicrobium rubrum]|uniref:Amidase n=1 Tax=Rubellimicrobium rubrum TaxID=2585369 RepID=A0A5C4N2G7_9RHOB|nr:amidase [Rubellimicrobium rubrum]TNC52884.1 amidase [Rubellimicrobium rubrum]